MSPTYRLALRAYPPAYRHEHADELVATANELSPNGWSARQARSLVVEGLRTRARLAAGPTGAMTWFDGAALGLALWYLLGATAHLTYLLGARGDIASMSPPPGLSAIASVGALVTLTITTRWPTAVIHSALLTVLVLRILLADGGWPPELLVQGIGAAVAMTAIVWWLALRGPGRRALSPTVALSLLGAATAISWLLDSPGATVPAAAVLVGLPVAGLALAAVDPRPVVAGATTWLIFTATALPATALTLGGFTATRSTILAGGCALWLAVGRYGTRRMARS